VTQPEITPACIFTSLIFPLTPDQFFKSHFQKQALVLRGTPTRLSDLKSRLKNLKMPALLRECEGNIHVWKKTKKGLQSYEADAHEALHDYEDGASLYLSSSAKMRDEFCKQLQYQMVFGFSGYFPGTTSGAGIGDTQGEIEIFAGKKGHYTDWHTDFQENFTVQISGTKKWRLKYDPGMASPLVGFSPHYKDSSNLEMQDKVMQVSGINMRHLYDRARL
jgi:ribosomal protein L16 Arg81 hydroxylase